eukprot:gene11781-15017_t
MKNTGHPANSWYTATADIPAYPSLTDSLEVDVAIIGGGYTGLGAAIELGRQGIQVAVLEGAQIGSGASGRNGGQIHTGQRLDPQTLEAKLGADAARQLWDMAEDAKTSLYALIKDHQIDCDLKPGLIHAWHKPGFATDDQAYAEFVRKYDYDQISLLHKTEVAAELGTDVYHGGILDRGGGHLHPLKLVIGMAKAAQAVGAKLYEHSPVATYTCTADGVDLRLANGSAVKAQRLLICGNGYMSGLDAQVDARV